MCRSPIIFCKHVEGHPSQATTDLADLGGWLRNGGWHHHFGMVEPLQIMGYTMNELQDFATIHRLPTPRFWAEPGFIYAFHSTSWKLKWLDYVGFIPTLGIPGSLGRCTRWESRSVPAPSELCGEQSTLSQGLSWAQRSSLGLAGLAATPHRPPRTGQLHAVGGSDVPNMS